MELAKEYWSNNNIYDMEKSIDYIKKSESLKGKDSIQKY